jgi:hypothetical protein
MAWHHQQIHSPLWVVWFKNQATQFFCAERPQARPAKAVSNYGALLNWAADASWLP